MMTTSQDAEAVKIKEMLKLIPNNFPVCLEDLEEIFKNEDYIR